jgi:hypothetical protein
MKLVYYERSNKKKFGTIGNLLINDYVRVFVQDFNNIILYHMYKKYIYFFKLTYFIGT